MKNQIGVIGLGTMGRALATNLLNNQFKVSGFNRSTQVTLDLAKQESDKAFTACETLESFVQSLEIPRKIILMVPAGNPVEAMIESLLPLLDKGDILMDCGNSFYQNTSRLYHYLNEKGIHYYGVGVSGGEKGALLGPSIMPSGDKQIYPLVSPFLEKISAKFNNEPCCAYIGTEGSGHFVKMVHNGIEYADMQIIAEIYLFFKNVMKLSNPEISDIFKEWNDSDVGSYLIEITSKILLEKDPKSSNDMVDMILDKASQKGTGKWTTIEAAHLGQNVSIIQSAVDNRVTSGYTKERKVFSQHFKNSTPLDINIPMPSINDIREAYYIGKLVAYAQGFSMLAKASKSNQWNLNLSEIAAIFRAGCIIQAKLLDTLMSIYSQDPNLENFLLFPSMLEHTSKNLNHLRHLTILSVLNGIPTPAMTGSLTYIDQLKSPSVGANLIQAQRDYFGAHTFERIDQEGSIHHEWKNQ